MAQSVSFFNYNQSSTRSSSTLAVLLSSVTASLKFYRRCIAQYYCSPWKWWQPKLQMLTYLCYWFMFLKLNKSTKLVNSILPRHLFHLKHRTALKSCPASTTTLNLLPCPIPSLIYRFCLEELWIWNWHLTSPYTLSAMSILFFLIKRPWIGRFPQLGFLVLKIYKIYSFQFLSKIIKFTLIKLALYS